MQRQRHIGFSKLTLEPRYQRNEYTEKLEALFTAHAKAHAWLDVIKNETHSPKKALEKGWIVPAEESA